MDRRSPSVLSLGGFVTVALLGLGGDGAAAQEKFTLADVTFLTGCWAGQMGSLDMREQWTSADGGMMQSTT